MMMNWWCHIQEKQEYEDVIQQLRMELKASQSSVERLKSVLSNNQGGGSAEENLKKLCALHCEQVGFKVYW